MKKILKLLGFLLLFIIPTLRVMLNFEKSIWEYCYYFLLLILIIFIIKKIFEESKSKGINILIFIIIILMIFDIIYFDKISMKVEPIIYMHYKYNIPYSQMKVIQTREASHGIANAQTTPRSSTIKINNSYVSLYYASSNYEIKGWKDDYRLSKEISEILEKYDTDYRYFRDGNYHASTSEYYSEYKIFINKKAQSKEDLIMRELKQIKIEYDIIFLDDNTTAINEFDFDVIINDLDLEEEKYLILEKEGRNYYYANQEFSLYVKSFDNMYNKDVYNKYSIQEVLENDLISFEVILNRANKSEMYEDGGSSIYFYDDFNIIVCNNLSGNHDVFIGDKSIGIKYCQ